MINKILKLMLIAFSGFTTACLLFIKFGTLSWKNFWSISGIFLGMILLVILFYVLVSKLRK
jgi:Na+/proline symporter